jgi:hypothetical protein
MCFYKVWLLLSLPQRVPRVSNHTRSEWYSQCLPVEQIDEKGRPILDDPYVATQVITTVFQLPTAGVVTTYITILTPAAMPMPMPALPAVPDRPEIPITAIPDTPFNPKRRRV